MQLNEQLAGLDATQKDFEWQHAAASRAGYLSRLELHAHLTPLRGWSNSRSKRAFDFVVAAFALVFLAPVMAITALAVRLTSEGPVLFRQTRAGLGNRPFTILKFRTMHCNTGPNAPCVTKAGDSRLTRIGAFLRRAKLDEFPQLINVLRGEMSLVGPRPKVPHHQTATLRFKPGITGAATLAFRNEEQVLHRIPDHRLDEYQVHVLMPMKTEMDDAYMRSATFFSDVKMIFRTVVGGRLEMPIGDDVHSLVLLNAALTRSNAMAAGSVHDLNLR